MRRWGHNARLLHGTEQGKDNLYKRGVYWEAKLRTFFSFQMNKLRIIFTIISTLNTDIRGFVW